MSSNSTGYCMYYGRKVEIDEDLAELLEREKAAWAEITLVRKLIREVMDEAMTEWEAV